MSSLGQLVAGVAHEINNPISFVYGNITHASGSIQDLLDLINCYQQHYPNPSAEILEKMEDIDYNFVVTDLPKLLASITIGTERIRDIVQSLRNFSRLNESEIKIVDIHEGIESTLLILRHQLKAKNEYSEIEVIKEYGKLPEVECYPGHLNQVLMNLLANAIDALEERRVHKFRDHSQASPLIRIHTEVKQDPSSFSDKSDVSHVLIHITDNGMGMTEEVRCHLFDPFFTTKPIGKGTGLGLSISYKIIVEKHKGQVLIKSELGQGSEFIIELPIRQSH
jgi:signal transduction histidine kinase